TPNAGPVSTRTATASGGTARQTSTRPAGVPATRSRTSAATPRTAAPATAATRRIRSSAPVRVMMPRDPHRHHRLDGRRDRADVPRRLVGREEAVTYGLVIGLTIIATLAAVGWVQ